MRHYWRCIAILPDYSLDQGKSDFNEAGFQIVRLDDIWKDCRRHRKAGDLDGWRWALHDAWLELSHDARRIGGDKLEENEYYEKKGRFERLITQVIRMRNMRALFKVLSDEEEFLRDLQNASGKGGKYVDPLEIEF